MGLESGRDVEQSAIFNAGLWLVGWLLGWQGESANVI